MRKFLALFLALVTPLLAYTQQKGGAGIMELTASSVMPSYLTYHYGPEMAFDGIPKTAWVEGVEGNGIGEYMELVLDREITADTIGVMPGYFDPQYFFTNNRVKTLRVQTENRTFSVPLRDVMEETAFSFGGPLTFKRIRFEIADVSRGTDPDTCIAEITFYLKGKKIPLQMSGAAAPQRPAKISYYRTGVYENETEGAFRRQYMVNDYGVPVIIIYREAFDLGLLTEISKAEYDSDRNKTCDGECLFIKIVPGADGSIESITTTYDERASTGVVSKIFSFNAEGLLSSMSVDTFYTGSRQALVRNEPGKSGGRLVIVEKFEYFQGGAGEAVTATSTITYSDRFEVSDYRPEYKTENIFSGPDAGDYGP